MYHTALNSIALHCAALSDVLYSTAQYSAAQHGTAPHSTVQYSSDVLLGKRFRCTYVQVHRLEYSFHLVSPPQFLEVAGQRLSVVHRDHGVFHALYCEFGVAERWALG